MNVIRHHAPGAQSVPFTLKMEHCRLDNTCDLGLLENAVPEARVNIELLRYLLRV